MLFRLLPVFFAIIFVNLANPLVAQDRARRRVANKEIEARLLDTRGDRSTFFMSDDGKLAVGIEKVDAGMRYALWDLSKGKLVRFLAAEVRKPVKPYLGNDEADFGAATDFSGRKIQKAIFSPDGKLIAGLVSAHVPGGAPNARWQEILIWNAKTGELKSTLGVENKSYHHHTFFFVDPMHIFTKTFEKPGVSLELIHVTKGPIRYLIKGVNYEMYGGSALNGWVPLCSVRGPFSINWRSGENIAFERPPAGSSSFAASRTWFSPDGNFFYALKNNALQVWNTNTKRFLRETELAESSQDIVHVATQAGLIARRQNGDQSLELIDVETNKVVAKIVLPFRQIKPVAIAHDGSRLAIAGDKGQTLLLDLPRGFSGDHSLVQTIHKAPITR